MHFFTSVYGAKYLPFLRVLLRSLLEKHEDAQVTVYWDQFPDLELELLKLAHPTVAFEHFDMGTATAADNNRRISMYLRYWQHFLSQQPDGTEVCLMDADMVVMQPLNEILPDDADLVFTWKVERFPINGGIIIARNNASVRAFFDNWLARTEAVMSDESLMSQALELFGAADQYAFVELLEVCDYTTPFSRDWGSGPVRFVPQPCAVLNETRSRPITDETKIFHLKSAWHGILLEDGDYTKWRTPEKCEQLQRYWSNHDVEATIHPWREYVINAVEKQQHRFPKDEEDEYVVRGIINSEMLAVVSLVHELDIDVIVESGRYLGQSTKVLAEALKGTNRALHSTELIKDEIADQAEARLRPYDNIVLHYGDAAEVIPKILDDNTGKRIAILLDGPKGPEAFDLFSRAIAKHENVVIGFIHDLRDSYPGMLNPNRVLVHEWFERIFFTDDDEYVNRFSHFDASCRVRGIWEPEVLLWRRIGSYGPTLGVINPTTRDRLRARKRIAEQAVESFATPQPASTHRNRNPLKKLHRVPGYSQGKALVKKHLGIGAPASEPQSVRYDDGSAGANNKARELLADSIDVTKHDIVIDCGANVGQEVEKFVDTGAMIYAFEPNPHAFAELTRRFHGRVNVVCFPMAVLDRNDIVRLYMHESSEQDELKWSVGSSILECKGNVVTDRYVDVPTVDLAEFIFHLNKQVRLLKMDIEGAEYDTLTKLLERGLTGQIDHILVETHEKKIPELRSAHQQLLQLMETHQVSNIDLSWI